jgi:hypothetical protein
LFTERTKVEAEMRIHGADEEGVYW